VSRPGEGSLGCHGARRAHSGPRRARVGATRPHCESNSRRVGRSRVLRSSDCSEAVELSSLDVLERVPSLSLLLPDHGATCIGRIGSPISGANVERFFRLSLQLNCDHREIDSLVFQRFESLQSNLISLRKTALISRCHFPKRRAVSTSHGMARATIVNVKALRSLLTKQSCI